MIMGTQGCERECPIYTLNGVQKEVPSFLCFRWDHMNECSLSPSIWIYSVACFQNTFSYMHSTHLFLSLSLSIHLSSTYIIYLLISSFCEQEKNIFLIKHLLSIQNIFTKHSMDIYSPLLSKVVITPILVYENCPLCACNPRGEKCVTITVISVLLGS